MNTSRFSWDALLIASIVFAAGALAQPQHAARADEVAEPEGRIVDLNSGATAEMPKTGDEASASQPAAEPKYWIGLSGRNIVDPALRTQFQLADDTGVVIEEVLKDSPAAKAGLRQHDIVLQASGEGVQGMDDLSKLVTSGGGKPIELKLIRLGKEETIVVTPEIRPAGVETQGEGFPGMGQLGDPEVMKHLMAQVPGLQNMPQGMRMFGPGIIINGQRVDLNSLPNGVAVTVEKPGDGPAKITVKQGDKTWNIVGDDPKSLEQLPEDVRNYVAQLMAGQGQFGNFNFNMQKELEQMIPQQMGQFFNMPAPPAPGVGAQPDPVLQKMEQLERQLQELQKRLDEGDAPK